MLVKGCSMYVERYGISMKTGHKYISWNEKKKFYVFHFILERDKQGKVTQQINKTAKTLEEILSMRNEYLRLQGISIELLKEYDYATAPKKEKVIAIPTFKQGFTKWVESVIVPNYRASTLSTYNAACTRFFPFIGSLPIDKITKSLIQEMLSTIQKRYKLSYCYVKKMNNILYKYFKHEIVNGNVVDNPCTDISLTKTIQKRITRAFTQQEKFKFLLTAKQELGYIWYLMIYMYFQTGLRRGELAALQWKDIDLQRGHIHITKTVSFDRLNGGEHITPPKTKQSNRIVPMKQNLIDCFKKLSKGKLPHDYVFSFGKWKSKSFGAWVSINKITENFSLIRDLAELDKDLTLHSTRKTFASELILKGVDLATVKMLGGWSSTDTLLNIYAHSNILAMEKAIRG